MWGEFLDTMSLNAMDLIGRQIRQTWSPYKKDAIEENFRVPLQKLA